METLISSAVWSDRGLADGGFGIGSGNASETSTSTWTRIEIWSVPFAFAYCPFASLCGPSIATVTVNVIETETAYPATCLSICPAKSPWIVPCAPFPSHPYFFRAS